MRKDFLPFSRPSIRDVEIAAVGEVLGSGWITTGHETSQFEENFRRYCGSKGAGSGGTVFGNGGDAPPPGRP